MKKHQESFIAQYGSPEQIHRILDKNPGVYFPGLEENPSYDATHLRREVQDHISPRGQYATMHSPSLSKYDHTKEDVDDLLKIQKYQLAQSSPHFGPEHFKKMLDGAHHQIGAHTLKRIPFDDEMHQRFFVDSEADWGRPKFKGLSTNKLFALAQNVSLNQDAFEKLLDHDSFTDEARANLIHAHPEKLKPEHIRGILGSPDNEFSRFALERNRFI